MLEYTDYERLGGKDAGPKRCQIRLSER